MQSAVFGNYNLRHVISTGPILQISQGKPTLVENYRFVQHIQNIMVQFLLNFKPKNC